ncbi:unnamed protein product [Diatraea saccharalis]|uniref:Regulatory protein zeste n=1 Tax=Diatraea saccharalis TaxID=40085 RepID=A0A9N9WA24_9NEOP|nr:unnamed protein product [Diatraea saccharalis]
MERRKASPEQLNMLLHFLEEDKELALGKFTGLDGRIRQTNAWITITEKLNANSGFGSGAIKTPNKWQQTWRDWKSNVKKKAFKIRQNRFTPGCNSSTQLTEAEERILRLICSNTSVFGLVGVPETSAAPNSTHISSESHILPDELGNNDPSTSGMKWSTDPPHYMQNEMGISLDEGARVDTEAVIGSSGVSSETTAVKPVWKKSRPVRLVHDRLLNLEEEKIRIEKQKLLEKKRCNNIRLKIEKDRLDIERQRNLLLEKLLVAIEAVAQR